jgi:hypothetical protein
MGRHPRQGATRSDRIGEGDGARCLVTARSTPPRRASIPFVGDRGVTNRPRSDCLSPALAPSIGPAPLRRDERGVAGMGIPDDPNRAVRSFSRTWSAIHQRQTIAWKALAGNQKQGAMAAVKVVKSYHSHIATSFHSDCRRLRRIKSTSGLNLSIEDDGMSPPFPFSPWGG